MTAETQTGGTLPRSAPLERFDLAGLPDGVQITPEPFVAMVDVRTDAPDGLPTTPSTWTDVDGDRAIWLGPDEWLVTSAVRTPAELEERWRGGGTVVDVSAQRTTLRLSGEHARDILSGGCSIDLHPRMFRPGAAVQTLLGQAGVILLATEDGYDILVRSSFAAYLACWLVDAAVEYR